MLTALSLEYETIEEARLRSWVVIFFGEEKKEGGGERKNVVGGEQEGGKSQGRDRNVSLPDPSPAGTAT